MKRKPRDKNDEIIHNLTSQKQRGAGGGGEEVVVEFI
jgi:hypothetical protein